MTRTVLVCLMLAAAGCDQSVEGKTKGEPGKSDTAAAPADNTEKNERDRDTSTLTPGDQGESETDRTITQKIRQGVVGTDALSMTAKNIKIITNNGVVTLRGPVKSEKEKTDIALMAQKVAGVTQVDNQLEVAAD